jgi:hypothetical protein
MKITLMSIMLVTAVNFNSYAGANSYTIVNKTDEQVVINIPMCGNAPGCSIDVPANNTKTGTFTIGFMEGTIFDVVPSNTDHKGKSCTLKKAANAMGINMEVRKSKLSMSGKTITCDVK